MNIRESDIEKAFCEWVEGHENGEVFDRQVKLPMGRADVIGEFYGVPFIAEIKVGEIDEDACTQLIGYQGQIDNIVEASWGWCIPIFQKIRTLTSHCVGVLVGKSINERARRVVNTCRVQFISYSINENGSIAFTRTDSRDAHVYDLNGELEPDFNSSVLQRVIDTAKRLYHSQKEWEC